MFKIGQEVKFVAAVENHIVPNTGMIVHKKASSKPDCVWLEFAGLPALDNLRECPLAYLEAK